jgi:hypothetical protein
MTGALANAQPCGHLLAQALYYAGLGWSIIPVAGKKPIGLWTPFQSAPADEQTLRRLFAKKGITGLAVILGKVSGGLAVRDFDRADSYNAWAAAHPEEAARMPTVKTAQGYHVYGHLEFEEYKTLPDGDGELRADSGHYVVLPPSQHPSGAIYNWQIPLPEDISLLPVLPASLRPSHQEQSGPRRRGCLPKQPQQPKEHIACVPCSVADAIEATLPKGPRQRNRKLFQLARRLKGIVPDATPAELQTFVTVWYERALPVIRTKDFAETWSDFQIAWMEVKVPWGASIKQAYAAALAAPEVPIDGMAKLGVLAALCRELQRVSKGTFFLSVRMVQSLFSVGRMTAWRWLKALEVHGVIRLIVKDTKRSEKASEWRFLFGTEGTHVE